MIRYGYAQTTRDNNGCLKKEVLYIDPVNGDDTNDGLTSFNPIKTFTRFNNIIRCNLVYNTLSVKFINKTSSVVDMEFGILEYQNSIKFDMSNDSTNGIKLFLQYTDFLSDSNDIRIGDNIIIVANDVNDTVKITRGNNIIFSYSGVIGDLRLFNTNLQSRNSEYTGNIFGNGHIFSENDIISGDVEAQYLTGANNKLLFAPDGIETGVYNENIDNHSSRNWDLDYDLIPTSWINLYTTKTNRKVYAKKFSTDLGAGSGDEHITLGFPSGLDLNDYSVFRIYGKIYNNVGNVGFINGNSFWLFNYPVSDQGFSFNLDKPLAGDYIHLNYSMDSDLHINYIILLIEN
jgi:hypothetical protein